MQVFLGSGSLQPVIKWPKTHILNQSLHHRGQACCACMHKRSVRWKANTAQRIVQVTEAECHHPSVPMEGQAVHVPPAGMLSSKKRSRQVKAPFEPSQTEYVKIPSAVKRPCLEAMTDRQKEVLARQKAGRFRMFSASCWPCNASFKLVSWLGVRYTQDGTETMFFAAQPFSW